LESDLLSLRVSLKVFDLLQNKAIEIIHKPNTVSVLKLRAEHVKDTRSSGKSLRFDTLRIN
jgi:hypothetical protein